MGARGLVHIITGRGRGKTTSAVGLAVRARGRGMRVLFAQFMKEIEGGEPVLMEAMGIDVVKFPEVLSPHFHPEADRSAIRLAALRALAALEPMMGGYGLVVLDEFNCLIQEGFVTLEEAVEYMGRRPSHVELVLTGRGAPEGLMPHADYFTEHRSLKHPASSGTLARPGIEY